MANNKTAAAPQVDFSRLPRHVAIILDGNGRWAKKRGLPRTAGHAYGAEAFRRIGNYCKAIGILLEDRNIAQVSMNMVNYEGTPLYYAYEMIRALADRYGVRILSSELVGLTPAKALVDCAEYYLKLENFHCREQVMEYHLIGLE